MAADSTRRQWPTWRLALAAVAAAILVLFIAENFVVVEVRLILWEQRMRLAWALLLAGGLGVVLGWLLARLRR